MTTTDPLSAISTNKTHQQQPVLGRTDQVENNAGGFVFEIDPLSQLRRFLTIGSAGGTYYVGEAELTQENAGLILALANGTVKQKVPAFTVSTPDESATVQAEVGTHRLMVDEIVQISLEGRAMKQNPTLFALAIACQHGTTEDKQYARSKITEVVRTGTHLFIFVGYLKQFGGMGMGLRKALAKWYTKKSADKLAYQLVKYREREGVTHRDVLRMVHPKVELPVEYEGFDVMDFPKDSEDPKLEEFRGIVADLDAKREAIEWSMHKHGGHLKNGKHTMPPNADLLPAIIRGFELVQTEGAPIPQILKSISLPWEALPDSAMNDPKVWDVMLDNGMPIGALLRQLPRLTKAGLVPQMGGRTDDVIAQLLNPEALEKARVHPFNVLVALKTYAQGHGMRSEWEATPKIIDALDEMYYLCFGFVKPTGKRTMLGLDVSGSMGVAAAGRLPMNCREVSAAMAMVTARVEPQHLIVGFTGAGGQSYGYNRIPSTIAMDPHGLTLLPVSKRQRLDDVVKTISNLPFGRTDCSLPMTEAIRRGLEIDTFVIYTDNETWFGNIHPYQALAKYRQHSGIDARLVVVSITPTKFSIADPKDKGMLDISGFDSAVPQLISDFSEGAI